MLASRWPCKLLEKGAEHHLIMPWLPHIASTEALEEWNCKNTLAMRERAVIPLFNSPLPDDMLGAHPSTGLLPDTWRSGSLMSSIPPEERSHACVASH